MHEMGRELERTGEAEGYRRPNRCARKESRCQVAEVGPGASRQLILACEGQPGATGAYMYGTSAAVRGRQTKDGATRRLEAARRNAERDRLAIFHVCKVIDRSMGRISLLLNEALV